MYQDDVLIIEYHLAKQGIKAIKIMHKNNNMFI